MLIFLQFLLWMYLFYFVFTYFYHNIPVLINNNNYNYVPVVMLQLYFCSSKERLLIVLVQPHQRCPQQQTCWDSEQVELLLRFSCAVSSLQHHLLKWRKFFLPPWLALTMRLCSVSLRRHHCRQITNVFWHLYCWFCTVLWLNEFCCIAPHILSFSLFFHLWPSLSYQAFGFLPPW